MSSSTSSSLTTTPAVKGTRRPVLDQLLELIDEVDHRGIGVLGMIGHVARASRSRCSAKRRRIASTLTGGAISLTLPPRRHTSLINDDEMKTLENEVIRKTVFTAGLRRRFIRAIWNSDSKSLITAQSAHDRDRARAGSEVHGEPVEGGHLDPRPRLEARADHLDPLRGGEQRRLAWVLEHPDDHPVEDRGGAVEDVEVPERHRIEAAGVHGDALAHAVPSDGAASRCRKLMVVRP